MDVGSVGIARLLVTILEGVQLFTKNQSLNSYCRVSVGDKRVEQTNHKLITQTKIARSLFPIYDNFTTDKGSTLPLFNATWNYSLQFILKEPLEKTWLCLSCFDEDPFAPDCK